MLYLDPTNISAAIMIAEASEHLLCIENFEILNDQPKRPQFQRWSYREAEKSVS